MKIQARRTLALMAVLSLALVGCRGEEKEGNKPRGGSRAKVADFFGCLRDSDCVVEKQKDCCPCNAGGREVAIHKDAVGAHRAAREARCRGALLCPQVYLCSDAAVAVCRAGRCELIQGRSPRSGRGP